MESLPELVFKSYGHRCGLSGMGRRKFDKSRILDGFYFGRHADRAMLVGRGVIQSGWSHTLFGGNQTCQQLYGLSLIHT